MAKLYTICLQRNKKWGMRNLRTYYNANSKHLSWSLVNLKTLAVQTQLKANLTILEARMCDYHGCKNLWYKLEYLLDKTFHVK